MQIIKEAVALQNFVKKQKEKGQSIGFVPTMGALHEGHLSLVRRSITDNDMTVVSIFVNPAQFNNPDDLEKYPRQAESDAQLLESVDCDVLFLPSEAEIYPTDFEPKSFDFNGLDKMMEGAHRPGHFEGVVKVVSRLFEIVQPDRAYFGEKDFQQFLIIKTIAKKHFSDIEIVGHSIQRTASGLAQSSRNERLSKKDKKHANWISIQLKWAQTMYQDFEPKQLIKEVYKNLHKQGFKMEYVEIANPDNLKPVRNWGNADGARMFVAAEWAGVRLIDNVPLF